MASPKDHINHIRLHKFSIGADSPNPLTHDLHHAVRHLSVELYSKDVHFLMELIQNAEDNEYPPDASPSLEFVMTRDDITGSGASQTLLVFNNEKGFSPSNIESLCSVGRSTKKGKRNDGYIGEKGIGFKSVFLVSKQPHVFSNGYRIKFSETPPPGLEIGYIVPEWVEDKPSFNDIQEIYGKSTKLPNTILILPLKEDKISTVKGHLGSIHPELILFMSKIKKLLFMSKTKKLRFREHLGIKQRKHSLSRQIRVRGQTELSKDDTSQSSSIHLSVEEPSQGAKESGYYMWKQRFPVKPENRVDQRSDIQEWVVSLAFQIAERLSKKSSIHSTATAGVYAFLPTEMVTGLPFIIQADFILTSSRETILFHNKWNKGIIECLPLAFCSAFLSLLKSDQSALPIPRNGIFKYLPSDIPRYTQFKPVRDTILKTLKKERIVYCEIGYYCTPIEARRILPAFRDLVEQAVANPSTVYQSTGTCVVHRCLEDDSQNIKALECLEVSYASYDWYSNCLRNSDLLLSFSEKQYIQFLCFLEENHPIYDLMTDIPLVKFINDRNQVDWASFSELSKGSTKVYMSISSEARSWLRKWCDEIGAASSWKLMPPATQATIQGLPRRERATLREWLSEKANIADLSVHAFSQLLVDEAKHCDNGRRIIRISQFLHYSSLSNHLRDYVAKGLCNSLPPVDNSGYIDRDGSRLKIMPKTSSRLSKLLGEDMQFEGNNLVYLSELYLDTPSSAYGLRHRLNKKFLTNILGAADIPALTPLDVPLVGLQELSKDRACLLLEWIQRAERLPIKFKKSISEAKWIKTYRGFQSPRTCLLFHRRWRSAGFQPTFLNFIDQSFYGTKLAYFKDSLQTLGVGVRFGSECCGAVAEQLQDHTDFNIITMIYSFLYRFRAIAENLKVWITRQDRGGEWVDPERCVCHDEEGLFSSRIEILDKIYQAELLHFFSESLGVLEHPRVRNYCHLWRDWSIKHTKVSASDCTCIWKRIVKHWERQPGEIKEWLKADNEIFKLPVSTGTDGDIELKSASLVFVPDNLLLRELFMSCKESDKVRFAWHPNPSDIAVDELFPVYLALGATNISEAVRRTEIPLEEDPTTLKQVDSGNNEVLAKGMYTIIMAVLAAAKTPTEQRRTIIKDLLNHSVFESTRELTVEYQIAVPRENGLFEEEHVKVQKTSYVRLHKDKRSFLIYRPTGDEQNRPLARFCLAYELAEAISSAYSPGVVPNLRELIELGSVLGFEENAVNTILLSRNLQVSAEDEEFLKDPYRKRSLDDETRRKRKKRRNPDEFFLKRPF